MRPLAPLLFALSLAAPAPAQSADRAIPWGANLADVRLRLGGVLREPRDGETGDAVLDGVSIAGCPATARLFVGDHGVRKVLFTPAPCPDLASRLERRYGLPSSARRAPDDVELDWTLPGESVHFVHVRVADPTFAWERQFVTLEREGFSAGR